MAKYLNREESKKIFNDGFIKYDFIEMCAFSRYAHNIEKWSKNKIEKHIRSEFFKNNMNIVLLQETIHSAVLSSRRDFLEQDIVTISKLEIEKISKIKNRRWQKAMFAILVFSKKFGIYNKKSLYFWQDIKDVCKKVGVYFSEKEFDEFSTYVGKELKYMNAVVRKTKLSWRIGLYTEGEIFCTIIDFSKIQDYLPYFCSICGKETKRKNGYCEEHAREKILESKKKWKRNGR